MPAPYGSPAALIPLMAARFFQWQTESRIEASAQALFEFHGDPRRLPEVMPPLPGLRWVELPVVPPQEGGVMELHWCPLGLPLMRWRGRWKQVSPPELLVDEMLRGPLISFEHEHRFLPDGQGGCRLRDCLKFSFGSSGIALLLGLLMCRLLLPPLFAWRHWRTRVWARKQQRAAPQGESSALNED
jgi:ligand-binding SRPBCC domain-containing protein